MKKSTFLGLLLVGCTVGPNYQDPNVCIPDAWKAIPCDAVEVASCAPPPSAWWEVFQDPLLSKYIHQGAVCNNNVLAAEYNILYARSLKQVTASKLFPQLDADFNALRAKLSRSGPFEILGQMADPRRFPLYFSLYSAFLDASWEVDLFGKTRRSIESACAAIGVASEQHHDLLLSVFAEIAVNYFEVRGYQQQILLSEKNIALLEKNLIVVRRQLLSGYRNGLDLERMEAELAKARAGIPDLIAHVYQGIYALSILTGHLPEGLVEEMLPPCPLPLPPLDVAIGVRSEILRRRPDVRKAERELAQATADIGVAVASFYPSVQLFGFAGYASTHFRNLFKANTFTWLLDGNVSMPLFHGGGLMGNLRASEAQGGVAAFRYQETVLEAIAEAEGDLVAYAEELSTSMALREVTLRNLKVMEITEARLNQGLVSITDLLDAERELISSERNLLTSHTQALVDLVALYKSLGGGWDDSRLNLN